MENLNGLSTEQLELLSARALALAKDLEGDKPSYALALEAGVEDITYRTVTCGIVPSYRGEAIVTMASGQKWKCVGRGPKGDAYRVIKDGYIEMYPIP